MKATAYLEKIQKLSNPQREDIDRSRITTAQLEFQNKRMSISEIVDSYTEHVFLQPMKQLREFKRIEVRELRKKLFDPDITVGQEFQIKRDIDVLSGQIDILDTLLKNNN